MRPPYGEYYFLTHINKNTSACTQITFTFKILKLKENINIFDTLILRTSNN